MDFQSYSTPQRRQRILAGVALSLLAHGALLLAVRWNGERIHTPEAAVARSMLVWVRATPSELTAPAKVEPKLAAANARPKAMLKPELRRVLPQRSAPGATPVANQAPSAQQQVLLGADAAPLPDTAVLGPEAPRFDVDLARRYARQIATKPDPERAKTAVGQIPDRALVTESQGARLIAKAKRRDCKDGMPGGLLAPLVMLLEKKDSGCKW